MLQNKEITNRVYIHYTDAPASDADLAAGITPLMNPNGYLRIYANFSVAGKLSVRVTRTGPVVSTEVLNGDTNLTAGASYLFDIPIHTGETITFRYSAGSGKTNRFVVDEYRG